MLPIEVVKAQRERELELAENMYNAVMKSANRVYQDQVQEIEKRYAFLNEIRDANLNTDAATN